MSLLKRLTNNLLPLNIGLLAIILIAGISWKNEKEEYKDTISELTKKYNDAYKENESYKSDIDKLKNELDYKINTNSAIGEARTELVDIILSTVEEAAKNTQNPSMSIDRLDAKRALKSAENRVIDEYIRVASLILATMEVETNFNYITRSNPNGTKDYGIMQVNDAIIPEIKGVLGEHIDPIGNRNHNVEGGSYEIYDCYLLAKDKHPEDVIWWTYAYYNRGRYFEGTEAWKNPKHKDYKVVHKQASVRSNKFKDKYEQYYNALYNAL